MFIFLTHSLDRFACFEEININFFIKQQAEVPGAARVNLQTC